MFKFGGVDGTAQQTITNSNSFDDFKMEKEAFSDVLEKEIKAQTSCCKKCFKYLLLAASYLVCISTLCLGFIYSTQIPACNQYCLVASFYLGLVGSLLMTNPIRIIFNALLVSRCRQSRVWRCLLAEEAVTVFAELQLVRSTDWMLANKNQEKEICPLVSSQRRVAVLPTMIQNDNIDNSPPKEMKLDDFRSSKLGRVNEECLSVRKKTEQHQY